MLKQTIKIMKVLRELNKSLEQEKKINDWVDSYINNSLLYSKNITILTPWSLAPSLKERYISQGNKFIPTKNELTLFKKEIKYINDLFKENGLKYDWWIYLSPSYLDSTRLEQDLEIEYAQMLNNISTKDISIIEWEKDVILRRQYPNDLLLKNFENLVDNSLYQNEILRRTGKWNNIPKNQLEKETRYKISCEAEEGSILMGNNCLTSNGDFIFMSLNSSTKLNFFSILSPDFEKRIVSVLKKYPWRL